MRYIIYGAGAIGGAIGGRLFAAGYETVLICRGAHLEAIREHGLLLRTPDGDLRLPVPAVGHPRELRLTPEDAVILTMKSQDTEGALADLEASGGHDLPIICCQNGVENERLAARRFARVYGMLVALPATFLDPGEVIAEGAPLTGVLHAGRYPLGTDSIIEQVCAAISGSRFRSEPDPAVMRLKYSKLLANLGNAVQALTGEMPWAGRATGAIHDFMTAVRQEALACYRAAGIDCASAEEYRERVGRFYETRPVAGQPRTGASTWQSLVRGHRRIEVDYLNGEIVLLGAMHGIPTPYNAVVRRLATRMAASGEGPAQHTLSELQSLVDAERVGPAQPITAAD